MIRDGCHGAAMIRHDASVDCHGAAIRDAHGVCSHGAMTHNDASDDCHDAMIDDDARVGCHGAMIHDGQGVRATGSRQRSMLAR